MKDAKHIFLEIRFAIKNNPSLKEKKKVTRG